MTSGLESVHLLVTYRCERECDHCFVWAGPQSEPAMSIVMIGELLSQAKEIDSVKMVYFEGGEPFMYFPTLVEGVRLARSMGFEVGIVTNGYWGLSDEDARLWLAPLAELGISDLSVSDDEYHRLSEDDRRARVVVEVAKAMGIPVGVLGVCKPGISSDEGGQLYFRGRAAEKIAPQHCEKEAASLASCPEDLRKPGRVHIDPFGLVHVCQGMVIGNTHSRRLAEIVAGYSSSENPVISALVEGGPAELVRKFGLQLPIDRFADDCHLCYVAREMLRASFPDCLAPDEMYGSDRQTSTD
jgi:hypothetical protein